MTSLEQSLNARLIERRTTGVSLTAAGLRLLAAAERMETEVLHAQAELTDKDFELSGTVRIGAPDGLSTYYLASRCAGFAERHPAITIQLVPTPQVLPLSKREVDIAIVLDKPLAGRFVTRKLSRLFPGDLRLGGLSGRASGACRSFGSAAAPLGRLCGGIQLFARPQLRARTLQ